MFNQCIVLRCLNSIWCDRIWCEWLVFFVWFFFSSFRLISYVLSIRSSNFINIHTFFLFSFTNASINIITRRWSLFHTFISLVFKIPSKKFKISRFFPSTQLPAHVPNNQVPDSGKYEKAPAVAAILNDVDDATADVLARQDAALRAQQQQQQQAPSEESDGTLSNSTDTSLAPPDSHAKVECFFFRIDTCCLLLFSRILFDLNCFLCDVCCSWQRRRRAPHDAAWCARRTHAPISTNKSPRSTTTRFVEHRHLLCTLYVCC